MTFRPIRDVLRVALVGLLAVSGLVATAAPAGASKGDDNELTCSGGSFNTLSPEMITSGTYESITVTGFCEVASGATIRVRDGLSVGPGGFLVAAGALDNGMQFPDCNRTIKISGGIRISHGGSMILGDGFGSGCTTNTKTIVNEGIRADAPLNLIVHGATVNDGFTSVGGGDNLPCNFAGFPTYATIEDSTINGKVTFSGYNACWLGFARNHIHGNVTFKDNKLDDPDAMEILDNTVRGDLACYGNSPVPTNIADGVSFEPNHVSGAELGQCVGL